MRSVELFTGAGGLALGLKRAGFEPVLMVERDDHAYATIKENSRGRGATRGWPIIQSDVRDVTFDGLGQIDLLAGGPPCQPFSIGGKHRGPEDPRDMWPQAVRAVRELTPRAFLFENVRGLTRNAFGEYLRYIIERLRRPAMTPKAGECWEDHSSRLTKLRSGEGEGPLYRVEVHQVNAADYGAAQKRHRVVIVGLRLDLRMDWTFPKPSHSRAALLWDQFVNEDYWRRHRIPKAERPPRDRAVVDRLQTLFGRPVQKPWNTVRDAIGNLPDPETFENHEVANHRFQPGARAYVGHTGSALDEPAKALKAGDHGVPGGENMLAAAGGRVRYFTVRESARLQGFPDRFVFPGSWTESMRQLGNAVPVPMAAAIAASLGSALRAVGARTRTRRAA